jgi:hypothetical protein
MPEDSIQPQTTSEKKSLNWKKISLILLVVLFLISLVGFGLYLLIPRLTEEPTSSTQPQKQATPSAKVSTPSAKKDETAGWKIFESKIHYYRVKYPTKWKFYRTSSEISPGSNYFVESVYLNLESDSDKNKAEPYIKIIGNFQRTWCEGNTNNCVQEEVELGGKDATKWTNSGQADEIYYVKPTSNYFVVVFVNYGGNKSLTDQVLSTLEFLN